MQTKPEFNIQPFLNHISHLHLASTSKSSALSCTTICRHTTWNTAWKWTLLPEGKTVTQRENKERGTRAGLDIITVQAYIENMCTAKQLFSWQISHTVTSTSGSDRLGYHLKAYIKPLQRSEYGQNTTFKHLMSWLDSNRTPTRNKDNTPRRQHDSFHKPNSSCLP